MIVDTHQHIGRSLFSGIGTTEEQLLAAMAQHGVNQALVMPQPTREPIRGIHDRIARLAGGARSRVCGIASVDPWLPDEEYAAEVRRCVVELGFVAVKLHPLGHNISPLAPEADKVFRLAAELGVPVIVHTGLGAPWSLPSLCIPPARRYPSLKVVLAHAGWGLYSAEAMVAAELCPNVYLEPSWCPTYVTLEMIRRFGPDRVMFGGDHLANIPVELTKYRAIGLSPDQLDAVLGGTARQVFGLAEPPMPLDRHR